MGEWVLYPFFAVQTLLFLYWLHILLGRKNTPPKDYTPFVTVIIPAYNEEKRIGRAIRSATESGYPNIEIIVADDGSRDRTSEVARSLGARVVRTPHVGKAEAINRALRVARGEVVVVLDADTWIEKGSLEKLVSPLREPDTVIAVGRMGAEGRGVLAGFQRIEYAFVSQLLLSHSINGKPLPFFFGAFMAVRRDFLEEVGGFPSDTPGEDFDLFVEAMERGKKIAGTDAKAFTSVPEKIPALIEQRLRWGKAGLLIAWKHRRMIARYPIFLYPYWPLYGLIGFPALLGMFLRYVPWHVSQGTLFEYLLSWLSYYGPIRSMLMLPQWGFPPLTVLGVILGALSLIVISLSWYRERGRPEDLPYLFFLPTYGTFFLGFVLFLIIPYTLLTLNKRRFIR